MIPEKEREALARLSLCARRFCNICKYSEEYTEEDCSLEIAKNTMILIEALERKDDETD